MLKNLFSLGRLLQMRSSWYGPKLQAIKLPAWMAQAAEGAPLRPPPGGLRACANVQLTGAPDSMEHTVRQAAEIVELPPAGLEKALNAFAAERVRTRSQLAFLCQHPGHWAALPAPADLKAELRRMLVTSAEPGMCPGPARCRPVVSSRRADRLFTSDRPSLAPTRYRR